MSGYRVFHRTWWQRDDSAPDGRTPGAGRKHTIKRHVCTEREARDICRVWNACHDEGNLSDRAEYMAE